MDKAENAYLDRPAVLTLLGAGNGQHILDVACGPGFYAEVLVAQGAAVLGVDASPRMIQYAQQRVPVGATFRVGCVEAPLTGLADESIDGIIAALVLDHVADWTGPFREFARVLRPGGRCVWSVEHPVWAYRKYQPPNCFGPQSCDVRFR